MVVYEQVEQYMKLAGLKYIKTPNDFIAGLAARTNKNYALNVANVLNYRAEGAPTDNTMFYQLKNESLPASLWISAAFDGGVFRHIGNIIIDNASAFGNRVLDLACDCGVVSCFMAQQMPDSFFTCVDINEKAIENAKEFAKKVGVENIEFVCADVYDMNFEEKFDTVTSFRTLLDVTDDDARHLVRIGERSAREKNFENAFLRYASVVASCLKDGGTFVSIERYAAEYGWLGWMDALAAQGIFADDRCFLMTAQDISSAKDYSVTFAKKGAAGIGSVAVYEKAMLPRFKSGAGCDGANAEFALYYDSDGEIEFTDIEKKDRLIHQFAFARSKNGKNMYFEADNEKKKLKYFNDKKAENMRRDYEKKLELYSNGEFSVKKYNI